MVVGFGTGGCGEFFRDIGGRINVRPGSERRGARCVGQAHILQRNGERRSYAGYFVCLGMI